MRQPSTLRDPEALSDLRSLQPEIIAVVAYGQLLRPQVLEIPPRGVLNVHPSLLPRHRGASPIPGAILAGDTETGVTIMLMDPGMDTGPILSQRSVPIEPGDTAGTLSDRLSQLGAEMLAEALPQWLAGQIEPKPQDDARATKTPLLRKGDAFIDWRLPAEDLWRKVRAYNPWPGAYTIWDGEMLHVWEAWPLESTQERPPGVVAALSAGERKQLPVGAEHAAFSVQTGHGVLAVLLLQRAGRKPLLPDDFLRGAPGIIGARLYLPG